jgi:hypothetical protein
VRARGRAHRRGGGARLLSLDAAAAADSVAAPAADLDQAYEREWALAVLERAARALETDFAAGRFQGPFAAVLPFLGRGSGVGAPSYAEAATACRKTVPQFKVFLHRVRARLRRLLAAEVGRTVADPADVQGELDRLCRALAAPS